MSPFRVGSLAPKTSPKVSLRPLLPLVCTISCIALFVLSASAQEPGQEKMAEEKMSKPAMAAKEMMMKPGMEEAMQKEMMGDDSSMPMRVAEEMVQGELMHDEEAKGMLMQHSMAEEDKAMMMHDQMMKAQDKMAGEPAAMQTLFAELVARHLAKQKMAAMMKKDPKMSTMAGKEMKKMVGEKEMMMEALKEMEMSADSAMMMAREELIHSLMLDKEVMAMVEKAAKMADSTMGKMMSNDKMMAAGEKMVKDPKKAMSMLQGAMAKEKVMSMKKGMMKKESTPGSKPSGN